MNKREYLAMYELEDSHFWFLGKRFFINSILKNRVKKSVKILDIGAGTGGTSQYLSKFGDVIGVEKNNLAFNLAKRRGVKVVKGDASDLKFNDKSFDLVTILDVLYHKNIKKESRVIKEAYRVLKPGGLLLVTDSAFDFLKSQHDKHTQGLRRYSLPQMVKLVKKEDFRILKSSYIFMALLPITLTKRLLIDKVFQSKNSDVFEIPWLINNILTGILKAEARLLSHFSLPFGTSVLVLAQKI